MLFGQSVEINHISSFQVVAHPSEPARPLLARPTPGGEWPSVEVATVSKRTTRIVACPNCGRERVISTRHARRKPPTCNLCRFPTRKYNPTDGDRRFWLERFTDDEIIDMCFGIFEEVGDCEIVASWRELLLPKE